MLDHAIFSGQATPGRYSQTFASDNFLVVFSLAGPEDDVTLELGRNLVAKIEEVISQTPEISPSEIVEMEIEQTSSPLKLDILVAKVVGQELTLSAVGEMGARMWRKDKIIHLLDQSEKISTVRGPIQQGDFLILGTGDFLKILLSEESLWPSDRSPEVWRDTVAAKIETLADSTKLAAIFLRANFQPIEEPAPVLGEKTIPLKQPEAMKPNNLSKLLGLQGRKLFTKGQKMIQTSGQWKKPLYLAVVIFIILLSILTYQLRSKVSEKNQQLLNEVQQRADQGLDASGKLVGLNDQIAREILLQTKKDVDQLIITNFGTDWQKNNSSTSRKLLAIEQKLDNQIGKTSHVYVNVSADIYYDFGLLKNNPGVVAANLHDGQIVALDKNNGAIYQVASQSKTAGLLYGQDNLKSGHFLDFSGDNIFLGTDQGIFQKKLTGSDSLKQVVKASDKWGEIKSLVTFGGNLYLLDPKNNQVWKYQGTDLGFSDLVNYVKTGLSVDITHGQAMAVDGFVYVLTTSGQIAKFAGGDISEFTIKGLPDPLISPTAFYTSEELQNLYVWDPGNNRIVVLDKKGNYQAQYQLQATSSKLQANMILADETAKKIFLVTKDKIFAVEMK